MSRLNTFLLKFTSVNCDPLAYNPSDQNLKNFLDNIPNYECSAVPSETVDKSAAVRKALNKGDVRRRDRDIFERDCDDRKAVLCRGQRRVGRCGRRAAFVRRARPGRSGRAGGRSRPLSRSVEGGGETPSRSWSAFLPALLDGSSFALGFGAGGEEWRLAGAR